jgi:hypothetical protein
MSAAKVLSNLRVDTNYETWLGEVEAALATMHTDMEGWQENWEFDFRREYDGGYEPEVTAVRAHDFWWQRLLAESWT